MTRIDELKSQIADKRKRMSDLNTAVETAKRVKSDVERTEFDNLDKEIRSLQSELNDVEVVERIRVDAPTIITSEQKEKNKRYSVTKAINEFSQNRLSGLENEMHTEAQRTSPNATGLLIPHDMIYKRTETFANSSGLYTQVAQGLDIIAPKSIIEKIGVTEYKDLTTTYKFNFAKGVASDSVAEGASLSGKTYTKVTDEIVPTVYGYTIPVSKQAMAVTSMVSQFILDADNAIQTKILTNLLAAIDVDAYALVGFSGATTGATMTSATLGKLKAFVLSAMFNKPGFVMGSSIYNELENTIGVAAIRTVLSDGKINGYNAFDVMNLLDVHNSSNYSILFGDWSRAYVGYWGAGNPIEVLVDPFTQSDTQTIKLTFSRMADYSYNPYVFSAIRNAKLS
jgi:HK97 family phage major capsid protein